ncbi:hypothetical protein Nstercoris_01892 [Nitrosomonas stercoris]|uniref:Outer membrane lipoprotein n=1 Tax=Nitrosomonas stercoris TaxID=1444684 RepID=A0A4Y1YPG4_9PROT|nr:hypothetical protein Nstercoris_01892 [Nitrosomonas stercoris]
MPPDIRDFSAVDIPYQLVAQNIEAYQDTPIRWGGTVIAIENEADFSFMQVLFYPLSRNGYPQTNQAGAGRFAVTTSEFIDPALFTKGTEVTVTGVIKQSIERSVGNKTISIPLIAAEAIHLWPASYREDNLYWNTRYRYGPYPGYYSYPFFYRRHYDPYYWW